MWVLIAIAALFVVWAAAYSAHSYSFWSAANPRTRLGIFPTAKKATEPFAGDIRRHRQDALMLAAGSGMSLPLIRLAVDNFYVVVAVILAGYVPSLATLAFLAPVRSGLAAPRTTRLRPPTRRPPMRSVAGSA